MGVFGVFVLTTALGVSLSRGPSSSTDDALRAIGKATYIQSGMDQDVKQIEKRYTPKVVKEYGVWIAAAIKIANEKRISLEWTF